MGQNDDDEMLRAGKISDPLDGTVPWDEEQKAPAPKPDPFCIKSFLDHGLNPADEAERRQWLLRGSDGKGVFPLGKSGLLVAGGGVGKTMALVQLAIAVALGEFWLGSFKATQGKVLLCLGEEDLDEVHRRLHNACGLLELDRDKATLVAERIFPLPLAGIPCALLDEKTGKDSDVLTTLKAAMKEHKFSLVILDPLSRWAGTDVEVDNGKATRFVQAVESIAEGLETKPSVLVAHHSSKSSVGAGEANSRGSSAIVDGFRWVANLDDATDLPLRGARLTNTKSNYSMKFEPIYLVRVDQFNGALRVASGTEAETLKTAPIKAKARAEIAKNKAIKEAKEMENGLIAEENAKKNQPVCSIRDLK